MTKYTLSTEEAKSATVSIGDDSVETETSLEQKASEEMWKLEDGSHSRPAKPIEVKNIYEELADRSSVSTKATTRVQPQGKVSEEIAEQANKSSYSKSKKKKLSKPMSAIRTPNAHDVLLGRGKPFQNHDGNQSMLRIVDLYRKRYHESERAFKHEIIEEVLDIIKGNGGRFLERIDDVNEVERSFWNQVPHRMAYRKVGHAFRSNARRISMEKRDQAHNQRRNISAMARASMMSQLISGREGLAHRTTLQGASLLELMSASGTLGLTGSIDVGRSVLNNCGAALPSVHHQRLGTGLNPAQREILAREQMLHSSRIERILRNNSIDLHLARSTSPHSIENIHSMLCGGGNLPYTMQGGNLVERTLQISDVRRRMMLLGSEGDSQYPCIQMLQQDLNFRV